LHNSKWHLQTPPSSAAQSPSTCPPTSPTPGKKIPSYLAPPQHLLITKDSQIREIPDHQEVYLDADGYSSIVVEILEYVNKNSDEEALQYHFADLIDGTGDSTTILQQEKVVFKELRCVHSLHVLVQAREQALVPISHHIHPHSKLPKKKPNIKTDLLILTAQRQLSA
jgi:hypothetical protein